MAPKKYKIGIGPENMKFMVIVSKRRAYILPVSKLGLGFMIGESGLVLAISILVSMLLVFSFSVVVITPARKKFIPLNLLDKVSRKLDLSSSLCSSSF